MMTGSDIITDLVKLSTQRSDFADPQEQQKKQAEEVEKTQDRKKNI